MKLEHRPPTSVDVARRAGVSRTTVSYVLNGTPHQRISQETRERVLAAARELDYHVQPSARALRRGRNDDIYFILSRPLTLFTSSLVSAMQQRALEIGYTLAVYFNDSTMEEARRNFLIRLFSQRPTGIVSIEGSVTPKEVELAKSKGAGPCVFVGDWSECSIPAVKMQTTEIGRLATRHLIERGHRRMGFIAPQNRFLSYTIPPRLAGMREALEEAGIHDLCVLPIEAITLEEARRVARQLAADPTRPTALYGFNDEYCFHLLRALREQGLRVPEDIALIGTDNIPFCELTRPSLTSIHTDIAAMGSALINLVDHLANNREGDPIVEPLPPPVLIPREST
ncbi:MAG: LacI family DNA-binding transcriptional regulator [Ktedonobacteraceae bacterium]|nr:LacI family DNA-binding transcriptional regulator [Ktedonobacteraceae bacterium]